MRVEHENGNISLSKKYSHNGHFAGNWNMVCKISEYKGKHHVDEFNVWSLRGASFEFDTQDWIFYSPYHAIAFLKKRTQNIVDLNPRDGYAIIAKCPKCGKQPLVFTYKEHGEYLVVCQCGLTNGSKNSIKSEAIKYHNRYCDRINDRIKAAKVFKDYEGMK